MLLGHRLCTLAAGAALIASGCASGGCGAEAHLSPRRFDGAAYPSGVSAPGFSLTDQAGRRVSLAAQRGHVVVLSFLSSSCRSCLLTAQQIRGALDELGSAASSAASIRTIFLSTAPHLDTKARATSFLADASLSSRASFLTGDRAQLEPVWRAYRIPHPQPEDAVAVLLIDKRGAERVAFGLEQLTPEALSHDIRLLQTG